MDNHTNRVPTSPDAGPRVATAPQEARPSGTSQPSNTKTAKKSKKPLTKARKISIAALIIGLIVLLGGLGFFLYRMFNNTSASDAEYLVQIGTWQREDAPTVIWDFTEIGKGTLTTNDHINDYEFTWALEGDTIKMDTEWLTTKNDEFTYHLDQEQNQLTIEGADGTLTFVPASEDKAKSTTNATSASNNSQTDQTDQEIDNTFEDSVENTVNQ